VRPGRILYELGSVPEDLAKQALRRVANKMPIKCRLVYRRRPVA
jgi:large subunit ribosomal protein L16